MKRILIQRVTAGVAIILTLATLLFGGREFVIWYREVDLFINLAEGTTDLKMKIAFLETAKVNMERRGSNSEKIIPFVEGRWNNIGIRYDALREVIDHLQESRQTKKTLEEHESASLSNMGLTIVLLRYIPLAILALIFGLLYEQIQNPYSTQWKDVLRDISSHMHRRKQKSFSWKKRCRVCNAALELTENTVQHEEFMHNIDNIDHQFFIPCPCGTMNVIEERDVPLNIQNLIFRGKSKETRSRK